jgi:predicted amidophosphoribosyltransferase
MYCILCNRLVDFSEYGICCCCMRSIERINERAYVLSLLKEAYEYITDIKLLDKIDKVLKENKKSPE